MKIENAFVLAAGYGTRLKPYTDTLPKPMVPVAGQPIIGRIFDQLIEAGVKSVVVNTHHKRDVLCDYFMERNDIAVQESFEETLLDTGGGAKQALKIMGRAPFYMINGDAFCVDGQSGPVLKTLSNAFDAARMDILLLLQPVAAMKLTGGVGDYDIDADNRPVRNRDKTGKYMFAGIRICAPQIFDDAPDGAFSFLQQMDAAEKSGRLYAHIHDGDWHHISTPDDLMRVDAALKV